MTEPPAPPRRRFLLRATRLGSMAAGSLALPMLAQPARAALPGPRRLELEHLHTGERLALAFAVDGHYRPEALGALDHFLRDHYSGTVGRIDPQLYEVLHGVQRLLGHAGTIEVVSGFRDAGTNAALRATRGGGVARHSLHMEGRALDVRLAGVPLAELRDAALALRAGGVGYYARERFVHLDTGRVRAW